MALALLFAVSAAAATIAPGDIAFVPVNGCCCITCPPPPPMVLLSNALDSKFTSTSYGAVAFGLGNRLYVTNAFTNVIDMYDSALNKTQMVTGLPSSSFPGGLAVFANGDLLVLTLPTLYVLSPAGAVTQSFTVPTAVNGLSYGVDLAPDQCTVFYIDAAGTGRRFNVCTGQPLANLLSGPWNAVRAFGDGGYLAARGATLDLFDANDHLVRTLTPQIEAVNALAFDIDPRYVWVGTIGVLAKVELSNGSRVLYGASRPLTFAVNGEQRPASAAVAVQDIPTLSTPLLSLIAAALIALAWQRLRS